MSVAWGWPSGCDYRERQTRFEELARSLTEAWAGFAAQGHPLEVGHAFLRSELPRLLGEHNSSHSGKESMPWLAALITCSSFDLALHDAFGQLHRRPVYNLYGSDWLSSNLASFLKPAPGCEVDSFRGLQPDAFLAADPKQRLPAWHLVGGVDPVSAASLSGEEPQDGFLFY